MKTTELTSDHALEAAVRTCVRAMRDNPLHCAVFGNDPKHRERKLNSFFRAVLPWIQRHGTLLTLEGETNGVIGLLAPGHCRPTMIETLRMLPALSRSLTPRTAIRMARWLAAWAKHDPAAPHWHLGPLAVDPLHQRRGIGTQLLAAALERIDAAANRPIDTVASAPIDTVASPHIGTAAIPSIDTAARPPISTAASPCIGTAPGVAYLETDTEANVAFYQRFGFVTIATARVVGVPNWFMQRAQPR